MAQKYQVPPGGTAIIPSMRGKALYCWCYDGSAGTVVVNGQDRIYRDARAVIAGAVTAFEVITVDASVEIACQSGILFYAFVPPGAADLLHMPADALAGVDSIARGNADLALFGALRRNTIATLGDSRMAETILPGPAHGSFSIINQANALSGARITPIYNGAVGGNRSDQYWARLDAALASGADTIAVWGWYNDINQGYTDTQIWNGYNGQIGNKDAFKRILDSGRRLIIFAETGGTLFDDAKFRNVTQLNQRHKEYTASNHGVIYVDLTSIFWDPTASSIAFRSNMLRDEVHPSNYGYSVAGAAFAPTLQAMWPEFLTAGAAQFEYNSNLATAIGINRVPAITFQTPSGGSAGAGITGTVPAAVSVSRSGAATAVISTAANADGFGNDLVVAATFTAAGEFVKVGFNMGTPNWFAGDIFRAGVTAYVDAGSVNFGGVDYSPGFTTSAGLIQLRDMYRYNFAAPIPNTALKHTLRTPVAQIAAGATMLGISNEVLLYGAGAGSATVRLNRPWVRKQFSLI